MMFEALLQLNAADDELERWDRVWPHLEEYGYSLELAEATSYTSIHASIASDMTFSIEVDHSNGLELEVVTNLLTEHGFDFVVLGGENLAGNRDRTSAIRLRLGDESYLVGTHTVSNAPGEDYTHLAPPKLGWIFPRNHRLKSLVQVFDSSVSEAASSLLIGKELIQHVLKNHFVAGGTARLRNWLPIFYEAITLHFAVLRDHVELSELSTTLVEINTSVGNWGGIVRENQDFVKTLMTMFFEKIGFENFYKLDWNSVVEVLLDLGDGVNGVYLNDLSRMDKNALGITETDNVVVLTIAPEYGERRRQQVRQHNLRVKKISQLEDDLRPYCTNVCIFDSLFYRTQGVCPVRPNAAEHPMHVYKWIVEIAKASYEEYMLRFEA
jgi:hypothetical protein